MATMISSTEELFSVLNAWVERTIPASRLSLDSESSGRVWFLSILGHSGDLKMESLRGLTDRQQLNQDYKERQKERDPKRKKGVSALKTEISVLYSFNKCAVQRYKGRLHYYRDDLSQKGKRNMVTMGQSVGLLQTFKGNLDS